MTDTDTSATPVTTGLVARPKRADARRNYDKLLAAAREAFAEHGSAASLEDIARRAEVGIGTLYRNFPTRQALLEAVYVEEVEEMARSVADFAGLEPWDALVGWLRRFVRYAATKKVVMEELLNYIDQDSEVLQGCRTAIVGAGEPLLRRAQESGDVRPDASFLDVTRMVGGIAVIKNAEPDQIERIFDIAVDGLRAR
jgi:AcrR family transcriptional regulator